MKAKKKNCSVKEESETVDSQVERRPPRKTRVNVHYGDHAENDDEPSPESNESMYFAAKSAERTRVDVFYSDLAHENNGLSSNSTETRYITLQIKFEVIYNLECFGYRSISARTHDLPGRNP